MEVKPIACFPASIIQMLGNHATKDELFVLRQLSGNYYNIFNPVYVDKCNIKLTLDPNPEYFSYINNIHMFDDEDDDDEDDEEDQNENDDEDDEEDQNENDDEDDEEDQNENDDEDDEEDQNENDDEDDEEDQNENDDDEDDEENENDKNDKANEVSFTKAMAFAYTCRKIKLDNVEPKSPPADAAEKLPGSKVAQFLENVAPNIKKLSFHIETETDKYGYDYVTYYDLYISEVFLKLLSGFVNLEKLKLVGTDKFFDYSSKINETFDVLPRKTQIQIHIFDSEIGRNWEKIVRVTSIYDPNRVSIFLKFFNIRYTPLVDVDTPEHSLCIESETAFQELTSQTVKWFRQTKSKFLPRVLIRINDNFTHQAQFMQNMDDFLSACGCKELLYSQHKKAVKWTLPSGISSWKAEITSLHLVAYAHPITFLKEFPKLEFLELDTCDLEVGLFIANPNKSEKENLKDIFRGLYRITLEFSIPNPQQNMVIANQYYTRIKSKTRRNPPTELGMFIETLVRKVKYRLL